MDPDFTACMQSKVDMAAESLQQQLFIWTCLRNDLCSRNTSHPSTFLIRPTNVP